MCSLSECKNGSICSLFLLLLSSFSEASVGLNLAIESFLFPEHQKVAKCKKDGGDCSFSTCSCKSGR